MMNRNIMNQKKWLWTALLALPLAVAGVVYAIAQPSIGPITGEELAARGQDSCCPATASPAANSFEPWQPIDESVRACESGCGKRVDTLIQDVTIQPGARLGQRTYCPVSGVVFQVQWSSPERNVNEKQVYFCCPGCATYFDAHRERVIERVIEDGPAINSEMNRAMVKIEGTACEGCAAEAEQVTTKDSKTANPSLISLFKVPLVCPAAPKIGCGVRAKPILLDLQGDPNISEAWLNSAGTVVAVIGTEGSSRESRAKAVQAASENNGATAKELQGEAREQELKSLLARDGWYRGAEVDTLTKQEAGIIAARLVRRIQAKVTLPDDKAKELELGLADASYRFVKSKSDGPQGDFMEQYNEVLLKVAQANLDEKGLAAYKEAIAKGYRPGPNEK